MKQLIALCFTIFCLSFCSYAQHDAATAREAGPGSGQQDTLQQYTGKYKFPEGSIIAEVEVLLNDGVLVMNSSAGSSALRVDREDDFSITAFNGSATFKRNNDKKIIGVHIEALGYTLDGTRESSTVRPPGIIRVILPVGSGSFLKPAAS